MPAPQDSQITYNEKITLSAPDGGILREIAVTVELEPPDAGIMIYGWEPNGNLGYVEVRGAKTDVSLPFAKPEIYIQYLGGLKTLKISTRGFKMAR